MKTKRGLRRVRALLLSLVAVFLAVEITLRVKPDILGPRLGNHVYARYGTFPGGIYYYDEKADMVLMKRGLTIPLYFNGFTWEHHTDANGFRNPDDLEAREVLLLGDSMIYGHGVEEDQTVAHHLRERHGLGH